MAIGPGKFDDLATFVREISQAKGVIVAIIGGNHGSGFSVQVESPALMKTLPELLRDIADNMEKDA
jgi:hypothetical protein